MAILKESEKINKIPCPGKQGKSIHPKQECLFSEDELPLMPDDTVGTVKL